MSEAVPAFEKLAKLCPYAHHSVRDLNSRSMLPLPKLPFIVRSLARPGCQLTERAWPARDTEKTGRVASSCEFAGAASQPEALPTRSEDMWPPFVETFRTFCLQPGPSGQHLLRAQIGQAGPLMPGFLAALQSTCPALDMHLGEAQAQAGRNTVRALGSVPRRS